MIVRSTDRVLVQGITGKQGTFWTERMQACGTHVVGGVNPKKAGEMHCGVPIFATAVEAMKTAPFDVSVMFIPPGAARAAAEDAIAAGVKLLVILTEHIPAQDVMLIHAAAHSHAFKAIVSEGASGQSIRDQFNNVSTRDAVMG